jgi:uncharacterized protein (DUF362 family)
MKDEEDKEGESGMLGKEKVSVVRCASTAEDAEVVRRTEEAIRQLGDYGKGLRNARKIAVKINAGVNRVVLADGKQTELTDPAVVEGAIRAIRDVTDAEIIIGDAPTDGSGFELYNALGYPERLKPYRNIRLLDFSHGELGEIEITHANPMFHRYALNRELVDADAFVSLAKMKAHASMGLTLCIKNLFGWMPPSVYGAPRMYLHDRLIRLPRVLADVAGWMKPCLNVVDGTVALNNSEWHGAPLRPGVIIAGTNVVATDSVGARVMGCDPQADYPDHPFFYRRNAIKLAAEHGFGPIRSEEIEVVGQQPEEVAVKFEVHRYEGDTNRDEQIRRGATCVERYLEQRDDLVQQYEGRYIALFDGEVLWDGLDMRTVMQMEKESNRDWQSVPQFIVRCVPAEEEPEVFGWYHEEASRLHIGL